MKHARSVVLLVALFLLVAALTSCAGMGAGDDSMRGMGHGDAGAREETTGGGTTGTAEDEMARQMLSDENGEYSDARFVDAMVPHHEGAVEMAQVALENAEHEEIRGLAEDIISTQEAEIETLGDIRAELGAEPPMRMRGEDMQMMGMTDPQELAGQRPFDKAFIDAMIPHHESAVSMANVALAESENARIRSLAEEIVAAQEREIRQMQTWRERWYPEG
jgi:uncharacterized protein (DUF305 family)